MDEKYIKDIYDSLGGESVFGNYDDYYSLITTDDSYIKGVYDSQGESVFGGYDDFVSLVKKKDELQPTSQEDATVSTTKEEKTPTSLESSESKFDYEKFLDKDEEEAIYDLQKKLNGKGYSIEETGIGNALLVTDNITGEQTEIDLKPIEFFKGTRFAGDTNKRAEEIDKVKKLIETPSDSKRALLSANKIESFYYSIGNNDIENDSFVSDLKNTYSNFDFELYYDPIRNGKVLRVSKGDVVNEFELQNSYESPEKTFSKINSFLYNNMSEEEASEINKTKKVDELKRLENDLNNIDNTVDISMESAEAGFYNENYFKGLFGALESAGVSVPQEAKTELEGGVKIDGYDPKLDKMMTSDFDKTDIEAGIQKYFGDNPEIMEKIKQYNLVGTINVRKQKIQRAKKLATEVYYENRPDRESAKEIILQAQKDLNEAELEITTNVEMFRNDLQKLIDGVDVELDEISKKNPGVKIEKIVDEEGVLQDIISSEPIEDLELLKNRINNTLTSYVTLVSKSKYDLDKINSKKENTDRFIEAADRNYNLVDTALADLKNATIQLGGGLAIVETLAEGAIEDVTGTPVSLGGGLPISSDVKMGIIRSDMAESREKIEKFYKTKRTYNEAISEGSKLEFGARTIAEQTPNIVLAIGTSGVGSSIGLSEAAVSTLIATEFGITSAGQKYDELTTRQEFGKIAEQGLKELESIKDFISEDDYLTQKYELERAIKDSNISATDKTLSVIGTGIIEGTVTRFLGTAPNSIKILKDLKAPSNFMDDILRSNYKATVEAFKEFGKRTGGEILEETSIDLLTQINDYAFLGDQIDLSSLDDVAVTSIITSGAMNTPSTAYSTILTQINVNRYKNKINSLTGEIVNLKEMLMDSDLTDTQRSSIHDLINNLTSDVASETTNMEGDALLLGSENIKNLLTLSGIRQSMLKKAGVENDDSYEVANAKIDNYLKGLDKDAAKKFTEKMKYVDDSRNKIIDAIDYEGAVEKVFGEKGTKIAEGLDDKLTPQQKYVEVYKQIRQEINDNAKKEFDAIQEQKINQLLEQDEQFQNELRQAEAASKAEADKDTSETDRDPKKYAEELKKTKDSDPSSYWSVDTVTEEDAAKGTVIDTKDGAAVVGADGDIKGVFKKLKSKAKGVAQALLKKAVEAGGTKLDNFVTGANGVKLQEIYEKAGFRVVSRTPFNEKFAPKGWTPKDGKPDVVAMVYDPNNELQFEEKTFDNLETGYDEMIAYRDKVLEDSKKTVEEDGLSKLRDAFSQKQIGVGKVNDVTKKTNIEGKAENARKSLAKLLPKVKINTYYNENDYHNAIGVNDKSRGTYSNGVIHINLTRATDTTVAHEVFHALLFDRLGSDAKVQKLTKRFVESLSRSQDPRLIQAFADSVYSIEEYKGVENEEIMAELFGTLAGEYKRLKPETKSLIKKFLERVANMLGLKKFTDAEVIDVLNTLAGKIATGQEITTEDISIINSVDNGTMQENTYLETDGTVVKTPSNRSSLINVNIKASDLLDTADIAGKPLEVVYYDNFTSMPYSLRNRVSGNVLNRQGEGGPGYSYRKVIKDNKIIGAFTTVTKGLNLIQGIRSRNEVAKEKAVLGIALQNKETGHLGNKTTSRDFYHPTEGVIAQSVNDGIITNKQAVDMLKDAVDAYSKISKGKDSKTSLGFTSQDFLSLDQFFELFDNISFERRGTFNSAIIPSKADLKITKATKPHIKQWIDSGIPTLREYNEATAEPYTKNAQSHDVVKYLDPDLNSIGIDSSVEVSDVERKRAEKMGVKIVSIDDNASHTSYPVVLFGRNIGVPKFFHSLRDMANEWNVPNPFFKAGRRKDTDTPKRIPEVLESERKANVERKQVSQRPSIARVFAEAKKLGVSEADTNTYLKELGYTDTEIAEGKKVPSSLDLVDDSEKAIRDKFKRRGFKEVSRYLRKKIFDRQTYIKDILKGIGNKKSKIALNRLVTKAGAKGWANYRFKEAEKKIFKGLSEKEIKQLNALIYARRIVAINDNRAKRNMDEYIGAKGYNYEKAKQEVDQLSNDKLSKRADIYFDAFNENLKRLFESGRISEETYNQLKDIEYSPIKTIKYIIGDNHNVDDMNELANSIGMTQKDIQALSDENINDLILDSRWLLMMNINAVENRAATNEVLNLFYDAIDSANEQQVDSLGDNILKNPIIGTKKSGAPKFKYDEVKVPVGYNKVSFYKNGVEYSMVMKQEYARQLIDIKTKDKKLKIARKFSFGNVLRFFATSGNPLFVFGNTAVDFQNILFLSDTYSSFKLLGGIELGFDFVKNAIKKMTKAGNYESTLEEFMKYGGGMDFLSVDGIKAVKGMRMFDKPRTIAQKGLVKWGNFWSYLGETSEVSFRLAVYEKSKSNLINEYKKENKKEPTGEDLENILYEAARVSRETIDFSQGGDLVKSADYVLPYLNASVQGVRKAVDYASNNPGGFASSMVQYAVMSGGVIASSLYMLMSAFDDDDDDKAEKIKDAWDSVSDYEKSAYHIVFTGEVNEDGEYEYYRFKKLPVVGTLSTVVEESIINQFLESNGVKYDFNTESLSKSLDKTSPIGITDLKSRNPLISGILSYTYNEDTFTGEEIFKAPRGKKILPEAEGIFDNKVEQIYKDIAPHLGMSPKRTQVMIEKVITNERTNPLIGIMYGGYNGVFSKETTVGEEMINTGSRVLKSFDSKVKRYTNKDLKSYKEMEKLEEAEATIETEIYKKEQEVYNKLKEMRDNGEDITTGFLKDIVSEKFDKIDQKKYVKKYYTYSKNVNVDRSLLDLIYEDTPEVQAYMLYKRFGDALEYEEKQELKKVFKAARRKLSKKALYIYKNKYKK